ncbi:ABC transporter permease [Brevibacillus brevis]|uniref:ABC transporter permease n=1 Tax=Brevibacillus brevis TaxID=1393 RepID=UPI000D0FF35B|nr:ABC transporter permease [Brevibacillus brevis]PSJ65505.1 peptide ABC transporter permease [Brevibacillus brevis]RED33941.1 putative ABC transport system permease protein [Brevibacillus brevis]GEC89448.1 ABC transporter permease [Brevibacillus brevis]VEF92489.1 Macrolide export ATP-binding/permease protein MacB [Brevibacillus brevis]
MNLLESFRTALEGIGSNKLRATLTMSGIIIGIMSVIAVITLGNGSQQAYTDQLEKLGATNFSVYFGWDPRQGSKLTDLTVEDADALPKLSPYIEEAVPFLSLSGTIRGPKKEQDARIHGTNEDLLKVQPNLKIVGGRYFTAEEVREGKRVIVLNEELAAGLFGREDPIGKRLTYETASAVVIGVVREDKLMFDNGQSETAYIPITYLQNVAGLKMVHTITVKAKSKETMEAAKKQTEKYLNRRHDRENYYQIDSIENALGEMDSFSGTLTTIFSVAAGIALFVGGIGVMNIMLVSVTERTREIGIRKALGARYGDIMLQFLIESMIVCLIGGTLGVLLGIGTAMFASQYVDVPPLLSWESIVIAFGFSSAIGIFFGLYPAHKAARLNPIDALRYE